MCSALQSFLQKHTSGKILVGLTAWDYPSGLLAERSGGIDIVLVADSLGKVILGLQGSISLTLDVGVPEKGLQRKGLTRMR
jgi:3-methyl-2-oxobutanoate hydroxymethyltransferase